MRYGSGYFFKVWTNRESISKVSSLKAYLFRMARNMVYDYYEHSLVKESYEQKLQSSSSAYTDLIEEDIYAKELSILIDIAIEQMPEQRRRIFKMSRKEGLSNEEISQKLQINKRTVENHVSQALADLREVVRGAFYYFFEKNLFWTVCACSLSRLQYKQGMKWRIKRYIH